MKINERDFFIILIGGMLLLISIIPIVINSIPETDFPFISLAILDSDNKTVNYYPMNNNTLNLKDNINWFVTVENHLNKMSKISLKIKIIDIFSIGPNSINCVPCSSKSLYEVEKLLNNNENWVFPLVWSINTYDEYENNYEFEINHKNINVQVNNTNIKNLKFIIELWVLNDEHNEFNFYWKSENGIKCAWTQLVFNIEND